MHRMTNRTLAAQACLLVAAGLLASCSSDSDDGGDNGGLIFPASDDTTDTLEPPSTTPGTPDPEVDPVSNPPESIDPGPIDPGPIDPGPIDPAPVDPDPTDPAPVDPEPVDPEPIDSTPIDPPPVEPGPIDPEPVAPDTSEPLSSLYGELTFILQFNDSGDRFRYATVLSEANLTLDDDGSTSLVSNDAGVFERFACFVPSGTEQFICLGVFPTGDLTLFGFELADGTGSGTFEECPVEQLQGEDELEACISDFFQTPDGSLAVQVTPGVQTSRVAGGDFIESDNVFQPLMSVNGQATRFQVFEQPAEAAERARIEAVSDTVRSLTR